MKTRKFSITPILIMGMMLLLMAACSKQGSVEKKKDACCPEPVEDKHAGHNHAAESKTAHSVQAGADGIAMCGEHNVPESECGICQTDLPGKLKPGEGAKVRLSSTNSAALAGIECGKAAIGPMADAIECFAEMAFDQNKLAQVAAPVGGILQDVLTDLGGKVQEKQIVAKIWSAGIAEAVAKAVLSHQTLERERKLRADRVTAEKDLQEAEAVHRSACQQLRTHGFSEEQIDALGQKPNEQVLMDVRAPFAGEIVERTAVRGALVDLGKPLFTLADRTVMWAMLNVPEASLARVVLGQTVDLELEALPGKTYTGKLTWIGPEVDERTRLARVRAEIPNPDGFIKAKMFARARILVQRSEKALLLPSAAIQRVEGKSFVFVKLEPDLFDARVVRLGSRHNGHVEILEGIKPEETVVLNHGFSLKSALLISRLGAGCADD